MRSSHDLRLEFSRCGDCEGDRFVVGCGTVCMLERCFSNRVLLGRLACRF